VCLQLPPVAECPDQRRRKKWAARKEFRMSAPQLPQALELLPLEEAVWQAWQNANRKEEAAYVAKQLKFGVVLAPLAIVAVLFWLFRS
jgi:hypothetical protein